MFLRDFCDDCGEETFMTLNSHQESVEVYCESVTIMTKQMLCTVCGGEKFAPEMNDVNVRTAFNVFREHHGLLSGEYIRERQRELGMSDEVLSAMVGVDPLVIQLLDFGGLQSPEIDRKIRWAILT